MEFIKKDISDGIEVVGVPVNRFKTNLITVSIALKLEKDKVSANSVMLGLLARRGKKYPNMLSLNRKLASLYGATLTIPFQKSVNVRFCRSAQPALTISFLLMGKVLLLNVLSFFHPLFLNLNLMKTATFLMRILKLKREFLLKKLILRKMKKNSV
mgnify:CR=1 FL=1